MYKSIVNPNTGKKIKCNSKLGRKIIQYYIEERQQSNKRTQVYKYGGGSSSGKAKAAHNKSSVANTNLKVETTHKTSVANTNLEVGSKVKIITPHLPFYNNKLGTIKSLSVSTHGPSFVWITVDGGNDMAIQKKFLQLQSKKLPIQKWVPFEISTNDKRDNNIEESHIILGNTMVEELYKVLGYIFVKFLGIGSYGLVCQFKDTSNNQYAIKILYNEGSTSDNIEKLKDNHRFIVENIEKCGYYSKFILTNRMVLIKQNYYIISEPLTYNLNTVLNNGYHDSFVVRRLIICQLIYGIYCLHKIGIIHGDIKLNNIFINYNPNKPEIQLKFADFDGSGRMVNGKLVSPVSITTRSILPHNINMDTNINDIQMCDDIFALGLVMLYLFLPRSPAADKFLQGNAMMETIISAIDTARKFDEIPDIESIIDKYNLIPEYFNGLRPRGIIKRMLNVNCDERITAKELFELDIMVEYCNGLGEPETILSRYVGTPFRNLYNMFGSMIENIE